MAFFDLPLEQLQTYLPPRDEPPDFDAFWARTLGETRGFAMPPRFVEIDYGLRTVQTFDVTFSGFLGQPIKGWLLLPRQRNGALPCVVEFIGYGGGRGFPTSRLTWSAAGYAHFIMDTRGQGSAWSRGDTPDEGLGANPQYPGFVTRGVLDPDAYYYRRLYMDACRAVEAACAHEAVDPNRIACAGISQGGGVAIAVSGLLPEVVKVALPDVPFLCHMRRAVTITDAHPYREVQSFLAVHRDKTEQVFLTLSYHDGMNFAVRAKAHALFSVALMDDVCPPSTVFAAYNYWAGPKDIRIYEFNRHEGGQEYQTVEALRFLRALW